jgi:4-hydroxy-tetrahydrodipicolinate reductase
VKSVRYALVGYGRMGRAIDGIAGGRGHERVSIIDPGLGADGAHSGIDDDALEDVEVAFEFTHPEAAEANVVALLEAGVAVVCGTTGWDANSERVGHAVEGSKAGVVVAPNFSPGMNLFYALVREASRMMGTIGGYEPFVVETHHRAKRDAPSGTARNLADIMQNAGGWDIHVGDPRGDALPRSTVHVASVRAGFEPGTHTVGFDGEHDVVSLRHRARGRGGFSLGAVLAAEWIVGRRGAHDFEEVLDDLLNKGDSE